MTPKEKAEELVLKFSNLIHYDLVSDLKWHSPIDLERNIRVKKDAKKMSLITIEQIFDTLDAENWGLEMDRAFDNQRYWQQVKKEINNL